MGRNSKVNFKIRGNVAVKFRAIGQTVSQIYGDLIWCLPCSICRSLYTRVLNTHEECLMVFIAVQNFVGIDVLFLIICKFNILRVGRSMDSSRVAIPNRHLLEPTYVMWCVGLDRQKRSTAAGRCDLKNKAKKCSTNQDA